MDPIIIIGTGLAGYNTAKEFRKYNSTTPLFIFTADNGNFYSKPLLSTGFTQKKQPEELILATSEKMQQQLNAEIFTNTVVKAIHSDSNTIEVEPNKTYRYSKLVLAWGAEPLHLNINRPNNNFFTVNSLEDYQKFRSAINGKKKIIIIGSGLVGSEFAEDLSAGGYDVSVVSIDPNPLSRFLPTACSIAIAKALQAKGVKWHFNATVTAVTEENGSMKVAIRDQQPLIGDCVLSAIGIKAKIDLAKSAGILCNQGVIVNNHLATNYDNIFAIGDCAEINGSVLQFISPLMACSRALGKTLNGEITNISLPALMVTAKIPSCQVMASPPLIDNGSWQLEKEGDSNITAKFFDDENNFAGFALTGTHIKKRIELAKLLPDFV